MGGKSGGSAPAAPQQQYGAPGQYIQGSFNPETGMPFENPNYQAPQAFEFHMPDFGAQAASQQADYASQLQAQQEEALRTQGLNDRDTLYSDYMSAADSAASYVNNQITQEASNAALLGIDYSIDDTTKSDRISNYFASIWGAGDQSRLEGLMNKWGNPEGFDGNWAVTRGDAGNVPGGTEAGEESQATSTGRKPTLAGAEEEDTTLGATTLLGA